MVLRFNGDKNAVLAGSKRNAVPSVARVVRLSRTFKPSSLPVHLRGGGGIWTLRRLRRGDSERLRVFFQSHSPETIRLRYGYPRTELSIEQAREMTGVDQRIHAALAVFIREGRRERIIAVGRYSRIQGTRTAETAFVVDERFRRRGLATVLLQALMAIARRKGLTHLTAETLIENYDMLRIFMRVGGRVAENLQTERTEVLIPL